MNILMIPSTMLPIPPVKGGAVQNLIQSYIDWNETNKKNKLVVFSIYDKKAKREADKLNYCKVKFFKLPYFLFKLRNSNNGIAVNISFKLINVLYKMMIKRELINGKYDDYLIVLDNTPQFLKFIRNVYKTNKICIHIYNDYLNKKSQDIEYILKNTDKIITVSEFISGQVLQTGLIGKEKVITLYNGIEIDKFKANDLTIREKLRQQYNIPSDAKVIIFVARLVPEKGIRELIQAFNLIDNNNVHLIIVGNKIYSGNVTDPFLLQLRKLAQAKKRYIHFTGYIDYNELPNYYHMADIGVLPSIYDEPFAMAAIEYMASGLGVILSDAGGFPEMAKGNAALIVMRGNNIVNELKKNIEVFLNNDLLLKEYQLRGRQRANMFSSENYCRRLDEIFEVI